MGFLYELKNERHFSILFYLVIVHPPVWVSGSHKQKWFVDFFRVPLPFQPLGASYKTHTEISA